jgi:hypothetical protein
VAAAAIPIVTRVMRVAIAATAELATVTAIRVTVAAAIRTVEKKQLSGLQELSPQSISFGGLQERIVTISI